MSHTQAVAPASASPNANLPHGAPRGFWVHELSGFTPGRISAFSGLPRSTAYRFIDPENNTLPTSRG